MFQWTCCGIPTTFIAFNWDKSWNCPSCGQHYRYHHNTGFIETVMGKAVTPNNYIGHYTTWCQRNNFAPLSWDILQEIFLGCVTSEDYEAVLNALYEIQELGFSLSFNNRMKPNIEIITMRLKLRLELFKRVPSATNMLLAYSIIEDLTLKVFAENNVDMDTKLIERFDKLKNLALDTKFINERKVAFERSLDIFKKLTKLEV